MNLLWVAVIAVVIVAIVVGKATRSEPPRVPAPKPYRIPTPNPDVLMPRGFDFYVRIDDSRRPAMLEAVRDAIGTEGTLYPQDTHAVVLWHDFQPPDSLLQALSADLDTEVIWLAFQKQVDAFGYIRWQKGSMMRRLTFGCYDKERTWEQVDGEPEAWEAAAIFDDARLERRLARSDRLASALGSDYSWTPEDKESLRVLWKGRRLSVDSEEPNINGRDVAAAVALHYQLPGWS